MNKLLACATLALLTACSESDKAGHRLFVIGVDGMDHRLTSALLAQGKLPNLKALADEGGFKSLGTSVPPESPVAWSNFITGQDPGGHGIFDFLHPSWVKDADDNWQFVPVDSVAASSDVGFILPIGGYELPMSGGEPINKRRGTAFWESLESAGVPATIFKMPANYPPTPTDQRTLSGMGTPDLQGGYGTYFVYTDDRFELPEEVHKGRIISQTIYDGVFRDFLYGPQNTLKSGADKPDTKTPLRVDLDPDQPLVRILIGDEDAEPKQLLLKQGEWSDFVEVDFDIIKAPGDIALVGVTGLVRFYLQQVRPTFKLFVDPINISPASPASDISTPADWSADLAEQSGLFETKGMPENTGALEDGVLSYDEFRDHAQRVYDRSERMLLDLVERHRSGALFYYFSTIDLSSHMFWRCLDDGHPGHDPHTSDTNRAFVESLYLDVDKMVGELRQRLTPDDTLIVMSDHGFAPYYRKFNLNTWLLKHGYLVLKEEPDDKRKKREENHKLRSGFDQNGIDWSKTRAYNIGFASIYLNVKGRDPLGIVDPTQIESLTDEICARLQDEVDPKNGKQIFHVNYKTRDVYHGDAKDTAPEIIAGFRREYRNSNESALGEITDEVLEDNLEAWSGCHLMAAEEVPGVVFSNRHIQLETPKLYDLTPTVLQEFGIDKRPEMIGQPLWQRSPEQ